MANVVPFTDNQNLNVPFDIYGPLIDHDNGSEGKLKQHGVLTNNP